MNSGELKVDVPLASIESDCEDPGDGCSALNTPSRKDNKQLSSSNNKPKPKMSSLNFDNGGDSVTGSLEDLVNSFDEKLTMCFQDYQEQVDKIAPVQVGIYWLFRLGAQIQNTKIKQNYLSIHFVFQVRSQEEIMNECQVWWTITGNFGNMMPIDWSKSTARAKQLPTLNLCNPRSSHSKHKPAFHSSEDLVDGLEDEDDLVAADLDMHSLILSSNPQENAVCNYSSIIRPIHSGPENLKKSGQTNS